jgi:hypothetical protein
MRARHAAAGIAICAAMLVLPGQRIAGAQSAAERQQMREAFLQRVDQYVALHRELERLTPPEVVTADLERLFAPRAALARELRNVRGWVREGNVFTPGVAVYLRVVIAETLRREGITELRDVIDPELAVHMTALVNADYPAGRSVPMMPCSLLAALPPLPPELRYSFVERDLILWDLHAGLIVDVVRDALPASFAHR